MGRQIYVDIMFDSKTMGTVTYIKMNSQNPLLLSEGVCHQLGFISYHPIIECTARQNQKMTVVPSVRVQLIQCS